jgi:Chlamydia polymorphic membrane protein (Chlamydia_PMP) repeat
MAGSSRRLTLAAIALPILFAVMSGLAQANNIFVNTTDGESPLAPMCSLPDAITAHNIKAAVNGCAAGTVNDTIFIDVTGTISIDEPLEITTGTLLIQGPQFGCPGTGPCGITIDGGGTVQILKADSGTQVFLNALTFNHGQGITSSIVTNTGGGAILADGTDLEISDCLFVNNEAVGADSFTSGLGGAIYANTGTVVITNSTFANNTAVGSICGAPGQPPTICAALNSPPLFLIGGEGGAIYDAGATLEMTNLTIADNSAGSGGGYAQDISSPIAPIKGTILQNNSGGNCGGVIAGDDGYNISSDDTCPFTQLTSSILTNSDLNSLANNGGPTDTFALQAISPAIDRIPIANCTDLADNPLTTDQRLFGRPDFANPNTCDSGAFEANAQPPIVIVPNTVKLAVARSTTANMDEVNAAFTFIYNGDPSCDLGPGGDEDALNTGFSLSIFEGTCASLPANGLELSLTPFVVHTVNHESYGTLFQTSLTATLQQSSETVSARLITLPTPMGACSAYALNLEVGGLNTAAIGMPDGNPFAIVLTDDPDPLFADASVCFDVNNAIVGNQTPPPPHKVRRRVRRR